MHKKIHEMPKNWPLPRKGNTYFMVGSHSLKDGIPLAIALRDILKLVKTAKEVRIMRLNKEISVNKKTVHADNYPIRLFDIVSIVKTGKNYRLELSGRKIKFKEISEKEANTKIAKIIGKVQIKKNSFQMNLEDGRNFLSKENFSTGDSAIISLKENKLEKILPLKEKSKVLVVSGKHSGKRGEIKEITELNGKKNYQIKFEESEVVLPLKTFMVIE